MPPRIIDLLEPVNIDHHDCNFTALIGIKVPPQSKPVFDPGERIKKGDILKMLIFKPKLLGQGTNLLKFLNLRLF